MYSIGGVGAARLVVTNIPPNILLFTEQLISSCLDIVIVGISATVVYFRLPDLLTFVLCRLSPVFVEIVPVSTVIHHSTGRSLGAIFYTPPYL